MRSIVTNGIKFVEVNPHTIRGLDKEAGHIITIEALPEECDAPTYWHEETDCFDSYEEAETFAAECSNPFWFCLIRVTVCDVDTFEEGVDYLGACNYRDGLQFVKDWDYCKGMIENAKKGQHNEN